MRVGDSDDDMLGNEEYDLLYPLQLRSISKRKEGRKVEMQERNKEVFCTCCNRRGGTVFGMAG